MTITVGLLLRSATHE